MDMIYNYLVNNRTPDVAILKTPGFSLNIYPAFRFLDKCSTNIIEFMVDLSIVDISPPNVYNLSQLTQFKFKIFTGFQLSCLEHFISFFDKNSQLDSELYLNRDCDDNNYEDSMCNMDYELLITLTFPFGEKKGYYDFDINICLDIGKGTEDSVKVSIGSIISNIDCFIFAQQLNKLKKYFY